MNTSKEKTDISYKVSVDVMVSLMKHHTGYSLIRGVHTVSNKTHPKLDMESLTGNEALAMTMKEVHVEAKTTNKKGKQHTKKGTLGYFFDRAVNTHIVVTRYKRLIVE